VGERDSILQKSARLCSQSSGETTLAVLLIDSPAASH
jgi:hypothetical protein